MTPEFFLILIFGLIILVSVIASVCGSNNSPTIIIDYRPLPEVNHLEAEESSPNLSNEEEEETISERLEESTESLAILEKIDAEPQAKITEYRPTCIPKEINKGIDELFLAIGVQPPKQEEVLKEISLPVSVEDFENSLPTIDEIVDQFQEGTVESPLLPKEYSALARKYGAEVVQKVTTTPGIGGTGEYDCMIGRVGNSLLKYADHCIPLKGMDEQAGVFLVEGMFIKPDLFFVSNYSALDEVSHTLSLRHAAGD